MVLQQFNHATYRFLFKFRACVTHTYLGVFIEILLGNNQIHVHLKVHIFQPSRHYHGKMVDLNSSLVRLPT